MVICQQQHRRSISLRVLGRFSPSSFAPFGRGALNEIRPHLSFPLFLPFQTGPRDGDDGRPSARRVRARAGARTQGAGGWVMGQWQPSKAFIPWFLAALYLVEGKSNQLCLFAGSQQLLHRSPSEEKEDFHLQGPQCKNGALKLDFHREIASKENEIICNFISFMNYLSRCATP